MRQLYVELFEVPISKLNSPSIVTIETKGSIKDALDIMKLNSTGSVVITKDGKLEGIATERDILTKVTGVIENLERTSITRVMTSNPKTLKMSDLISTCIKSMNDGGYRHIPVVNIKNEPVSMVSIKDLVSYIGVRLETDA